MDKDLEQSNWQDGEFDDRETTQELYWEDYEYEFQEKSTDWFWILGTISLLLIVIAITLKNFLLALIIFLSSFILGAYAKRDPKIISYGLTRKGVKHGDVVFPYSSIKTFWVDKNNNQLIIESTRAIKPHVALPIGKTNSEQIRKILLPIIKEEEYHSSLSDILADFFGF